MYNFVWNGKYFYAKENPTIRADKSGNIYGGGGTKTQVVSAPTTPAPEAKESAESLYQARLKYDPLTAAMEYGLQQQYAPQYAALQAGLYGEYAPQVANIQEQLRRQYSPYQAQVTDVLAQRALGEMARPEDALLQTMRQQAEQRLTSPMGYTPEQQVAIDAIRQRQREQSLRQMRERAEMGGGLYGGRAIIGEQRGMQELEQAFAQEDIQRQLAQQQQAYQQAMAIPQAQVALRGEALRYAIPTMQQLYPQVQFPGQPSMYPAVSQGVTPSADALYNAMFQASQPNQFLQQGQPSPMWGLAGALGGGAMTGWSTNWK